MIFDSFQVYLRNIRPLFRCKGTHYFRTVQEKAAIFLFAPSQVP